MFNQEEYDQTSNFMASGEEEEEDPGSYPVHYCVSSSSSLFGMRSVGSLSSIPNTASLNKLCIPPHLSRPVVLAIEDDQSSEELELQQSTSSKPFPMKELSPLGQWNNLSSSSSSSHLFHYLSCYSPTRKQNCNSKDSGNNKSFEVLPIVSSASKPIQPLPQVQFFLSQKQQLKLQQLENQQQQQKVVTTKGNRPGTYPSSSSVTAISNGVTTTGIKEPTVPNSSADHVGSQSNSIQSSIHLPSLQSPNLAATNSNNQHTSITNQGNNNSNPFTSSSKMKCSPPTSASSQLHHLPSPTSSANNFSPLTKSKSKVSLVKPVLISNGGPSINSGTGHHTIQRSSSLANLHLGGKNSMVRSLPLSRTTAPVQLTIPSQRVQPQTSSKEVPSVKRAAVVFPSEQHNRKSCNQPTSAPLKPFDYARCQDVVPEIRDHPAGLDIDEFLPKHIQNVVRLGISQPEMPEPEAMNDMIRGHRSVITALAHRKKNVQIVLAVWSSKDPIKALDQAIQLEDESVLVDILNVINLKPSFWTLDLCQMLLPSIHELLLSKYESYMSVGCASLKLILKNFSTMITTNITAPPGIGVDISGEERYSKCMTCYKHLLSVRAFLLKRQTMQGKLGRSFRELSILMQNLE